MQAGWAGQAVHGSLDAGRQAGKAGGWRVERVLARGRVRERQGLDFNESMHGGVQPFGSAQSESKRIFDSFNCLELFRSTFC